MNLEYIDAFVNQNKNQAFQCIIIAIMNFVYVSSNDNLSKYNL